MRWTVIRLIFFRELRDQLRDRRTIFMIVVLPLLLYPILGVAVLEFAQGFTEKPSVIGIVGSQYLPAGREDYPSLIVSGQVQPSYFEIPTDLNTLHVVLLDSSDRGPLEAKKVDLILTVPSDFFISLQEDRRPSLQITYRD